MQLANSHGDCFENINKTVRYYGAGAVKTNTASSTNYDGGTAIKVSEISKRDIDLSRASARCKCPPHATGSSLIPFPIPRGYAAEGESRPFPRFSRVLLVNARINALDYTAERSIRRAKTTVRMLAFSRDRRDARKMFENSVDPALTRFPLV